MINKNTFFDGELATVEDARGRFEFSYFSGADIDGDVCIIYPDSSELVRQFRSKSISNTILLTEQCDQVCIMCSQPPKNKKYTFWGVYKEAALLTPRNTVIGISGGEPTLEKEDLLMFVKEVIELRPDLTFHILSNAQHFHKKDTKLLREISSNVLWGIPLYSHIPGVHDEIVGKAGAYNNLMKGLNILFSSGATIEIRTVLLKQNIKDLPKLADFISRHLSFCETWAIMQLEKIGYAKLNWKQIFVDSSTSFSSISNALNIASIRDVNCKLYNFPLCTIPSINRDLACKSISDWKNKFLNKCNACSVKEDCCGFFDWYDEVDGFKRIQTI